MTEQIKKSVLSDDDLFDINFALGCLERIMTEYKKDEIVYCKEHSIETMSDYYSNMTGRFAGAVGYALKTLQQVKERNHDEFA